MGNAFARNQATTNRVGDGLRLLEDLLQHIVWKTIALHLIGLPLNALGVALHAFTRQGIDIKAFGGDPDNIIVLEIDGRAYQNALERARARAAKEAEKAAQTGKTGPGTPAEHAATFLKNEESVNSRLFAVDVGLDARTLRAKYPDRTRYAIVRGKVRASYQFGRGKEAGWTGYIENIQNGQINVPLEFRRTIERAPRPVPRPAAAADRPAFEATVAFGRRFEPWIVAASAAK